MGPELLKAWTTQLRQCSTSACLFARNEEWWGSRCSLGKYYETFAGEWPGHRKIWRNMPGISTHAISMLEAGRRRPRLSSVHKIATALDLDDTHRDRLIAAALQDTVTQVLPDPIADSPSGVPRQLPADTSVFVSRLQVLAELDHLIAPGGDTTVASAITGTAGVGKPNPGI
jgi:hypothetical protein